MQDDSFPRTQPSCPLLRPLSPLVALSLGSWTLHLILGLKSLGSDLTRETRCAGWVGFLEKQAAVGE